MQQQFTIGLHLETYLLAWFQEGISRKRVYGKTRGKQTSRHKIQIARAGKDRGRYDTWGHCGAASQLCGTPSSWQHLPAAVQHSRHMGRWKLRGQERILRSWHAQSHHQHDHRVLHWILQRRMRDNLKALWSGRQGEGPTVRAHIRSRNAHTMRSVHNPWNRTHTAHAGPDKIARRGPQRAIHLPINLLCRRNRTSFVQHGVRNTARRRQLRLPVPVPCRVSPT